MRRWLQFAVLLAVASVSLLCAAQWKREWQLRAQIAELSARWKQENSARVEAEQTAAQYAREIERLGALRQELESQMLKLTEEVDERRGDQAFRGYSIAVLMNEVIAQQAGAAALRSQLQASLKALEQARELARSSTLKGGEGMREANETLRRLTRERDEAIGRLNQRTREFNEVVERYNRLVRQRS
jgi:hypothetical protein